MEFKDTDRVQIAIYDKDFEYRLFESDGESIIYFADPSPGFGYEIKKINENEIVLEGKTFEDHSCYFERK